MSKHRLIVDDDYEFLAFGISCHLKDFRVAWNINKMFHFDLIRGAMVFPDRGGHNHAYPSFLHRDPDNHLRYLLLSNYSEDFPLIKSLRQYNYFMLVEGYIDIFDSAQFMEQLSHNEAFLFVNPIDNDPLKKFQYALFED